MNGERPDESPCADGRVTAWRGHSSDHSLSPTPLPLQIHPSMPKGCSVWWGEQTALHQEWGGKARLTWPTAPGRNWRGPRALGSAPLHLPTQLPKPEGTQAQPGHAWALRVALDMGVGQREHVFKWRQRRT